jgi:molybdopterin-guanine dinucleotide biosynthesis protein A
VWAKLIKPLSLSGKLSIALQGILKSIPLVHQNLASPFMIHQKHAKLSRPALGNFARHEWAIIGTPCGIIQKWAQAISQAQTQITAFKHLKIAYADADHKAGDADEHLAFCTEYTDKIGYHRLDFEARLSPFQYRSLFNEADLVLVNGNHFEAQRQIVVLDERKFDSLSRKLNRLTQVDAFLSLDTVQSTGFLCPQDSFVAERTPLSIEEEAIPDFLKNHLPHWQSIPIFSISDTESMLRFLIEKMPPPIVKGLILAGGRSTRMGRDKAFLDYHGKPQHAYLADILRGVGVLPFISCRAEQAIQFSESVIPDSFLELGPYGAILSAFREDPNAAWLVLACDLPLLDTATVQELINQRNPSKLATSFKSPESEQGFPEPLIAIWEPRAYPILLSFLAQGISCPRKVLINTAVEILAPSVSRALTNVNTPEEWAEVAGY